MVMVQMEAVMEQSLGGRTGNRNRGDDSDFGGNIYPLIHAIYYVDTVKIVEIEKQYKQECV